MPAQAVPPPVGHADNVARRLRAGGAWVGLWRLSGLALAFLVNLALPRLLLKEDFGRFTLIISLLTFCSVIARGGLDRSLIRLLGESTGLGDRRRAEGVLLLVARYAAWSIGGGTILSILAVRLLADRVFELPSPSTVSLLVGAGVALLAMLQMQASILRGFHELRFASLFDTQASGPAVNALFLMLLGVSWLAVVPTLHGVVLAYLAALAILIPIAVGCVRKTARSWIGPLDRDNIGDSRAPDPAVEHSATMAALAGMAVPLLIVQLLQFAATQADVWIAGARVADDQLALLGAVRRLMQFVAIPLLIVNSTVLSTIPALHAQGDLAGLERILRRSATLAALPSAVVLVTLAIFPGDLLALMFGPSYRAGATPLVILALGQIVFTWTGSCGNVLAMTGRHRLVMWVSSGSTSVLVGAGYWAAGRYGITGLAIVSACVTAANNVLLWLLARRFAGVWTHAGLGIGWSLLERRLFRRRGNSLE